MREIKFRGKTEDGWRYASMPDEMVDFWMNVDDEFIDPATVGQWTGLKDCNGVEIYEGDKLKSTEHPQDPTFAVNNIIPIDRLYASYDTPKGDDWMSNSEYYEVIGNIHEVMK